MTIDIGNSPRSNLTAIATIQDGVDLPVVVSNQVRGGIHVLTGTDTLSGISGRLLQDGMLVYISRGGFTDTFTDEGDETTLEVENGLYYRYVNPAARGNDNRLANNQASKWERLHIDNPVTQLLAGETYTVIPGEQVWHTDEAVEGTEDPSAMYVNLNNFNLINVTTTSLSRSSITFEGFDPNAANYVTGTVYNIGDRVQFRGQTWVSQVDGNAIQPLDQPTTNWEVLMGDFDAVTPSFLETLFDVNVAVPDAFPNVASSIDGTVLTGFYPITAGTESAIARATLYFSAPTAEDQAGFDIINEIVALNNQGRTGYFRIQNRQPDGTFEADPRIWEARFLFAEGRGLSTFSPLVDRNTFVTSGDRDDQIGQVIPDIGTDPNTFVEFFTIQRASKTPTAAEDGFALIWNNDDLQWNAAQTNLIQWLSTRAYPADSIVTFEDRLFISTRESTAAIPPLTEGVNVTPGWVEIPSNLGRLSDVDIFEPFSELPPVYLNNNGVRVEFPNQGLNTFQNTAPGVFIIPDAEIPTAEARRQLITDPTRNFFRVVYLESGADISTQDFDNPLRSVDVRLLDADFSEGATTTIQFNNIDLGPRAAGELLPDGTPSPVDEISYIQFVPRVLPSSVLPSDAPFRNLRLSEDGETWRLGTRTLIRAFAPIGGTDDLPAENREGDTWIYTTPDFWDVATTYNTNDRVLFRDPTDPNIVRIYTSLVDSNVGNTPPTGDSTAEWRNDDLDESGSVFTYINNGWNLIATRGTVNISNDRADSPEAASTVSGYSENVIEGIATEITSGYRADDEALSNAYTAADAVVTSAFEDADDAITAAYEAADTALMNGYIAGDASVTAAFQAADDAITTAYEAADTSIRTDFAAADTSIREDFAAADAALGTRIDGVVTDYQAADDAITAAYEAADTSIRTDFAAADTALGERIDGVITDYQTADTALREYSDGLRNDQVRSLTALPLMVIEPVSGQGFTDTQVGSQDIIYLVAEWTSPVTGRIFQPGHYRAPEVILTPGENVRVITPDEYEVVSENSGIIADAMHGVGNVMYTAMTDDEGTPIRFFTFPTLEDAERVFEYIHPDDPPWAFTYADVDYTIRNPASIQLDRAERRIVITDTTALFIPNTVPEGELHTFAVRGREYITELQTSGDITLDVTNEGVVTLGLDVAALTVQLNTDDVVEFSAPVDTPDPIEFLYEGDQRIDDNTLRSSFQGRVGARIIPEDDAQLGIGTFNGPVGLLSSFNFAPRFTRNVLDELEMTNQTRDVLTYTYNTSEYITVSDRNFIFYCRAFVDRTAYPDLASFLASFVSGAQNVLSYRIIVDDGRQFNGPNSIDTAGGLQDAEYYFLNDVGYKYIAHTAVSPGGMDTFAGPASKIRWGNNLDVSVNDEIATVNVITPANVNRGEIAVLQPGQNAVISPGGLVVALDHLFVYEGTDPRLTTYEELVNAEGNVQAPLPAGFVRIGDVGENLSNIHYYVIDNTPHHAVPGDLLYLPTERRVWLVTNTFVVDLDNPPTNANSVELTVTHFEDVYQLTSNASPATLTVTDNADVPDTRRYTDTNVVELNGVELTSDEWSVSDDGMSIIVPGFFRGGEDGECFIIRGVRTFGDVDPNGGDTPTPVDPQLSIPLDEINSTIAIVPNPDETAPLPFVRARAYPYFTNINAEYAAMWDELEADSRRVDPDPERMLVPDVISNYFVGTQGFGRVDGGAGTAVFQQPLENPIFTGRENYATRRFHVEDLRPNFGKIIAFDYSFNGETVDPTASIPMMYIDRQPWAFNFNPSALADRTPILEAVGNSQELAVSHFTPGTPQGPTSTHTVDELLRIDGTRLREELTPTDANPSAAFNGRFTYPTTDDPTVTSFNLTIHLQIICNGNTTNNLDIPVTVNNPARTNHGLHDQTVNAGGQRVRIQLTEDTNFLEYTVTFTQPLAICRAVLSGTYHRVVTSSTPAIDASFDTATNGQRLTSAPINLANTGSFGSVLMLIRADINTVNEPNVHVQTIANGQMYPLFDTGIPLSRFDNSVDNAANGIRQIVLGDTVTGRSIAEFSHIQSFDVPVGAYGINDFELMAMYNTRENFMRIVEEEPGGHAGQYQIDRHMQFNGPIAEPRSIGGNPYEVIHDVIARIVYDSNVDGNYRWDFAPQSFNLDLGNPGPEGDEFRIIEDGFNARTLAVRYPTGSTAPIIPENYGLQVTSEDIDIGITFTGTPIAAARQTDRFGDTVSNPNIAILTFDQDIPVAEGDTLVIDHADSENGTYVVP